MADIKFRPAVKEDILRFYPSKSRVSMKAITATLDGEPAGIGGVFFEKDCIVAFAMATDELRKYPLAIYKGAILIKQLINSVDAPIMAVADPKINRSADMLEHLGFEYLGPSRAGEVYQWNQE